MGGKLLWVGLTTIVAVSKLVPGLPLELVGAIVMIIGLALYIFDK